MTTLLLKNIHTLATMDDVQRELKNASIFIRDNVIEAVGSLEEMPEQTADEVYDLSRHVVIPGLINTHHHMFQNLTRVIAQDKELFDWLVTLYPIWRNLRSEHINVSAKLAMAELILSGCTTSSDHLYIYPNDCTIEDEIRAAQEIGMRFHAARGSMSLGESSGGLPPDSVVENEADILRITRDIIETHHDASRYAMLRVVVAPCSPFTVSKDLMREAAELARSYGVHLHTHLAENVKDIDFSLEQFGQRPGDYVEDVGWVGDDVWHAHCVQLNHAEIGLFARTGTGVCHCPSSNMRLASGIAPIRHMLDEGVKVGLGVDGSASNDSGHLLNEARNAMLLQRVKDTNPGALTAREALHIATRGSASVLGRDDVGAIAPGMAADIAAYNIDTVGFAGALHDPIAALMFGQSINANQVWINGRGVVRDGHLTTVDLPVLIETHNRLSQALINGA
ncbi:8-oxoguanine deaminase [Phototrophicus methaneseepsis]|uniref:8-oxoguanine deaminase n=1 Tax=Phototrophicus methaneseepsis TaxID=2710758 RepID=A0A7S8E703_9CHLR|nr:8-oxoguanine deaminase [Phototrophicus methaneseepsis]QPC81512.1 8-oxoguanine deaminase [Phototrophicus methaneseepsis]